MNKYAEHATLSPITDEDLALDRELEQLAKQNHQPIDDLGPALEVKKPKENLEHLKSYVEDYKPASNMAELTEQIHVAKGEGCDSIDGTATLVRQLFRKDFDYIEKNVGYAIYHDIRIYIDGHFEKNKGADKLSIEQRLFPKGKEEKRA